MAQRQRLTLECLEDRSVPAIFGTPWPDGQHLTLSFAPDGTATGSQTSSLFQQLGTGPASAAWQREILRAFQTWAVNANLNIGIVPDGGAAFGSPGSLEGDPRFGDIRVGAAALSPEVIALSLPFNVTAGTWGGDVTLNTGADVGPAETARFDLYTVMLHEAGHVFGVEGSTNTASAMYQKYLGQRTGLSSADVKALQAIYGARQQDAFDAKANNDNFAKATRIGLNDNLGNAIASRVEADVTALRDVDYYRFKTEIPADGLTIRVRTSGVSLLAPRVTLLDRAQRVLAASTSTPGGDGTFRLNAPEVGVYYYLRVESGSADVFGIGGYQVEITPDGTTLTEREFVNDDAHADDSFLTAHNLTQLTARTDARFDYFYQGSVADAADVDVYRIDAPKPPAGAANVLVATVWDGQPGGLMPRVDVFDAKLNPVSAEVLVNENGTSTVQIPNAVGGARYYLKVRAAVPQGPRGVGNYSLGVDFNTKAVTLTALGSGTLAGGLTDAARQDLRTLQVNESQWMHFVLSGRSLSGQADTGVRLTVYDEFGNVVTTLAVVGGETQSLTLRLAPGKYTFRFAAATRDGSTLAPFAYDLRGLDLSDPIVPALTDPTANGGGTTGGAPIYQWFNYGYYLFVDLLDAYGTPWW